LEIILIKTPEVFWQSINN